ncbi:MAG: hypothetical protein M3Q29_03270 [Chloroflexota bacterium]|nr:hypothetical protein [Chloroflexota bacterium]
MVNRSGPPGWVATLGMAALVLLLISLSSIFLDREPDEEPGDDALSVRVVDIAENPDEFYERSVTVRGEVGQVINPRTFVLQGNILGRPEPKVLVVLPERVLAEPPVGEAVEVRGTVCRFWSEEFAEGPDASLERYDGGPVIIALSVREPGSGSRNTSRSSAGSLPKCGEGTTGRFPGGTPYSPGE